MAGAGRRTFQPGEVLTASNVNSYLMDQSVMRFATSAARGSAIGTAVIAEGMVSYIDDANQLDVYDGASWNPVYTPGALPVLRGGTGGTSVAQAQENLQVGSSRIIPPTVNFSGGTATANSLGLISFSAVTSISLNNVFTSAHRNYQIIYNITSTSVANDLWLRLRGSGSDISTNTYSWGRAQLTTAVLQFEGGAASNTNSIVSVTSMFTEGAVGTINVYGPQLALPTRFIGDAATGASTIRKFSDGINSNSTAYDGFTLLTSSGNMTGTVQLFGVNV